MLGVDQHIFKRQNLLRTEWTVHKIFQRTFNINKSRRTKRIEGQVQPGREGRPYHSRAFLPSPLPANLSIDLRALIKGKNGLQTAPRLSSSASACARVNLVFFSQHLMGKGKTASFYLLSLVCTTLNFERNAGHGVGTGFPSTIKFCHYSLACSV